MTCGMHDFLTRILALFLMDALFYVVFTWIAGWLLRIVRLFDAAQSIIHGGRSAGFLIHFDYDLVSLRRDLSSLRL